MNHEFSFEVKESVTGEFFLWKLLRDKDVYLEGESAFDTTPFLLDICIKLNDEDSGKFRKSTSVPFQVTEFEAMEHLKQIMDALFDTDEQYRVLKWAVTYYRDGLRKNG